jgi:hypothetical protein
MELRESQRICVSGEAGTVIGEIVGVETPETMPNCHPDPCTNEEAKPSSSTGASRASPSSPIFSGRFR